MDRVQFFNQGEQNLTPIWVKVYYLVIIILYFDIAGMLSKDVQLTAK